MRKTLTRIISALAALCLLSGCAANGKAPAGEAAAAQEPVQMATLRCLYPLPANVSIRGISTTENLCIVAGETQEDIHIAVLPFSISGTDVSFSDGKSFTYEARNHVYGLAAGEDNFYLLAGNRGEGFYDADAAELCVLTISFSGELVGEAPLDDTFADEPRGFCRSGDSYIIGGSNYLKIFAGDGGYLSTVNTDYELWALQPSGSGAVVQLNKNNRFPLYFIDASAKLRPLDWADNDWLSFSRQDYGGKLLFGSDTLYEYDMDTGSKRELMSWLELTGDIYRGTNLCRIAEDCYLYSGDGATIYLLATEYKADLRSTVRVAYMGDNSQSNAQRFAAAFNMQSADYRATATMYDKQQLDMAISVGDCPDVILYSFDSMDTTTNQFMDLTPFLEKSEVISKDYFLPGLIDSLSVSGELHELWYSIGIDCWAGEEEYIEPFSELNWDDYCRMAEELGEMFTVLHQEETKKMMLRGILERDIHSFVDLDSWTCSFNSPEFAELLRLCNEVGLDYSVIFDSPDYASVEAYLTGYVEKQQLIYPWTVGSVNGGRDWFNIIRSPFSESYASYCEAVTGSKICVPARCGNVDGAYSFLEYVLCAEVQTETCLNGIAVSALPSSTEALEYCIAGYMSPEDAAKLRFLIDSEPEVRSLVKDRVIALVQECAQAYFAGDKSLEDTVDIIQSRAGIYLAEKAPLKNSKN